MSNTPTKKDEKEVAKDVATLETAISNLSYTQLAELLRAKKDSEIEAVSHKLKEARGIVTALEAQLDELGVVAAPVASAPAKRAYTRKVKNSFPPKAKATRKTKGKRGAVGEAITTFVASAGKEGVHVKDIAKATGFKVPNITAYFYSKGGKAKFKNLGSATFALKK